LSELPQAQGLGIDISPDAVAVAADNARRLGLGGRARFQVGDWAAGLAGPFDVILSNPPYIAEADRAALPPEILGFDPPGALFAGADGLDAYRVIAVEVARLLTPEGIAVIELGQGQEEGVIEILGRAGLIHDGTRADLAGIPRSICCRRGKGVNPQKIVGNGVEPV